MVIKILPTFHVISWFRQKKIAQYKHFLQPPVDVLTTANRKCAYMKHYGFSHLLGYLPPNMFK